LLVRQRCGGAQFVVCGRCGEPIGGRKGETVKLTWKSIGIFDSGVGGLTVLKETVTRYALQVTSFLVERDIKLLVVACNTASAVSLDTLTRRFPIPIIGVIEPGAKRAALVTRNGKVGVIGTTATIQSSAYAKAIKKINREIEVVTRACPLFVPLAEEGWVDNEIARLTAKTYLQELKGAGVDTLVLGCTHYPLLKGTIAEIMGDGVQLVDSAEETARTVAETLNNGDLLRPLSEKGNHHYFVTDVPAGFIRVGNRFLGGRLGDVYQINLEDNVRVEE